MKILHANQKLAEQIAKNTTGMCPEPLEEQGMFKFECISGNDAVFDDLCVAHRVRLHYPSGRYRVYAPTEYRPTDTGIVIDVETSVCRLQDIDWWGIPPVSKWDGKTPNPVVTCWNDRYAKPRKTKDGKGYVCYPYDENAVDYKALCIAELSDGIVRHKGLPLYIYENCWVEVHKYKREIV